MKKKLALLLVLLFLFGCAREAEALLPTGEQSSGVVLVGEAESGEDRVAFIASPTLEERGLQPFDTLEVYRFWSDGGIYSHEQVEFLGEQTVLSAVNLAASSLPFVTGPLPILGITMEKSFVTVDFSKEVIERYSKQEINELLNTIAMTLLQNNIADSFRFTREGEIGVFGETWKTAALAVAQGDPAEFAAIRAAIPYPGLGELYYPTAEEIAARFGVTMDETAMEIARLLARVGKMEHDAASPRELEPSRLYYHCVLNTPYFSTEAEEPGYEPSLVAIADSVSAKLDMKETMFWIGEHVRRTAKLLCGDDFELDLAEGKTFKYQFFPLEGVITPPHMGGGYNTIPLILSCEETGEGYRAEVVYLFESMGGIGPWGMERNLSGQELPAYVKNEAERSEITVRRVDDGRLCFESYHVKPSGAA